MPRISIKLSNEEFDRLKKVMKFHGEQQYRLHELVMDYIESIEADLKYDNRKLGINIDNACLESNDV